jgi:hypothetical protein
MVKRTVFAILGFAFVLALASPPNAHARVVIGVGIGPVFVPRPAYGSVIVAPRPYHAAPYLYAAPGYVRPYYVPRADSYSYRDYRDGNWGRRDVDHRSWDHRDRDHDRFDRH